MSQPILVGTETEYGLAIEGRGAEHQVDDALELLKEFEGVSFSGWDDRDEYPRTDLRGFRVERLATDPVDAEFDRGRASAPERADLVLGNGARFYNDHGHPEYATPECFTAGEVALHDIAGERVVQRAGQRLAEKLGRDVRLYKNNTDYHGASYGSHESYLVPRGAGFEALYRAITPVLVARTVLCGGGKVGSESGAGCAYQLSQRADFMTENANVETLFRRPVFNTRDEPHADPKDWIRLHVICGDANRIASAVRRRTGLVQLALTLWVEHGFALPMPTQPVAAFQGVSRDLDGVALIGLEDRESMSATELLLLLCEVAEARGLTAYEGLVSECRDLLAWRKDCPERFAMHVDWAAKHALLSEYVESEGLSWVHPSLASIELDYHDVSADSLYASMVEAGRIEPSPDEADLEARLVGAQEPTRAFARGLAVQRHADALIAANWRRLTFETHSGQQTVELPPERGYSAELAATSNVAEFIRCLEETK